MQAFVLGVGEQVSVAGSQSLQEEDEPARVLDGVRKVHLGRQRCARLGRGQRGGAPSDNIAKVGVQRRLDHTESCSGGDSKSAAAQQGSGDVVGMPLQLSAGVQQLGKQLWTRWLFAAPCPGCAEQ